MKFYLTQSYQGNPYVNLGYEEYMFHHLKKDEALFYLWQNQHTVVIGKNQNAFKECKVKQLQDSDGHLARRSSGGGAVYHDLGNLNFTFIMPNHLYDVHKQLEVIVSALNACGIEGKFAGRNDIEVQGFKVSGNAFAKNKSHSLHHGTLIMNVNMSDLSKYLNVSAIKMASKGVDSVRKRVANLVDFMPNLTLKQLKDELISSFKKTYQIEFEEITMDIVQAKDFIQKHESKQWQTNKMFDFNAQLHHKFSWGEVQAFFIVEYGIIKEVKIYSDTLIMDLVEYLENTLINVHYDHESLTKALSKNPDFKDMAEEFNNKLFEVITS